MWSQKKRFIWGRYYQQPHNRSTETPQSNIWPIIVTCWMQATGREHQNASLAKKICLPQVCARLSSSPGFAQSRPKRFSRHHPMLIHADEGEEHPLQRSGTRAAAGSDVCLVVAPDAVPSSVSNYNIYLRNGMVSAPWLVGHQRTTTQDETHEIILATFI